MILVSLGSAEMQVSRLALTKNSSQSRLLLIMDFKNLDMGRLLLKLWKGPNTKLE